MSGVSGKINLGISFSPKARLEWLTRLEIKVWGLSWWRNKQTITFLVCRLPSYCSGSGLEVRTGQRYKVPVLRYRTPCGSNTNIWTNDKCKGWAWASPEVQLAFIDLYGEIRESRVYICPVLATSPECPGFPGVPLLLRPLLGGKVWFIMCSFTHSIHFLSYLVSSKPNISISSSWFRPEKMSMRAPVKSPYNTKMVTLVFGSFRYFSLCYYNYYFDFYIYSDASSPQIFNIMLEAVVYNLGDLMYLSRL